ncbi:helix-turn-helix domain-containing protein [Actinoplanes sp. CA-131856]
METDSGVPPPPYADEPIGVQLAQMRHAQRVTGRDLGRRIGMSQSKLSKIETGAMWPSGAEVRRFAEALGAEPDEIERLVSTAERLPAGAVSADRVVGWQRDVGALEAASTEYRTFQPGAIPGLLQTDEYARAVLGLVTDLADGDTQKAIVTRLSRQIILGDQQRRFHFVLPETTLMTRLMPADGMLAQLFRLREVNRRDNVKLQVADMDIRWPYPPVHGFTILDDSRVVIDLIDDVRILSEPAAVRRYRRVFDLLASAATSDVEEILDRCRLIYLRRAQEQTGQEQASEIAGHTFD